MKLTKRNSLTFLLVALLVVALFGAAFFTYRAGKLSTRADVLPTPTPATNLVSNPSFELGTPGYRPTNWLYSRNYFQVLNLKKDGTYALKYTSTYPDTVVAENDFNTTAKANTKYTLSGWVYVVAGFKGNAYLDLVDRPGECHAMASILTVNNWQKVSCTFNTSTTGTYLPVRIVHDGGAVGTTYWDLVEIREGFLPSPKPNLVKNPSFEICDTLGSGTCIKQANWACAQRLKSSSFLDPYHLSWNLNADFYSTTSPKSPYYICTSDPISVNPNTNYTLSGWFRPTINGYGPVFKGNAYLDLADISEECQAVYSPDNNTSFWRKLSCNFKTSATRTIINIRIVHDNNPIGAVGWDLIELKEM